MFGLLKKILKKERLRETVRSYRRLDDQRYEDYLLEMGYVTFGYYEYGGQATNILV